MAVGHYATHGDVDAMLPTRTPAELVEQLRHARRPNPAHGDERIRSYAREGRGPYWVREQYRECNCPDCDKDAHWMMVSGSPNREDLERPDGG